MGSEWREFALCDLVADDSPITYGVVKPGPEDPAGVAFIRGGDIANGRILVDQLRTITPEVSGGYKRTLLRGGELLVSLVGNPGQVAIVPTELRGAQLARQVGLIRLRDDVDTRFVMYALSSAVGQALLGAHSIGSVQQVINLGDLRTVRILMPPLAEQRSIAGVLGALDDKIDLNRRMSQTLESMARALFKSWFVDFDPMRREVSGRVGSAILGRLHCATPAVWRVGCVADLAEVTSGSRPEDQLVTRSVAATVPVWGGNGPFAYVNQPLFDGPLLLTGRVGTLGSVFRINSPCWPSDNTLVLTPKRRSALEYLFLQLKELDLASLNRGSTQPLLTQTDLKSQPVLLPPDQILDGFSAIVRPLYDQVDLAEAASATLSHLRDTLIPALILGSTH